MPHLLKLAGGVVYSVAVFGLLLFLPAWTVHWPRAWVLLGVVFVASTATMFGIFPSRPDLLDERYRPPVQKGQPLFDRIVLLALMVSFFALIVFIPIDVFRLRLLGGPPLPLALLGLVMFVVAWTLIALALRENAFAAPVWFSNKSGFRMYANVGAGAAELGMRAELPHGAC